MGWPGEIPQMCVVYLETEGNIIGVITDNY